MKRGKLKLGDVPSWPDLIQAWRRIRRREKLRNALIWGILQFTGLRLGEVLALKVEDIDFKRGVLRVRQEKKRREFLREVIVPEELLIILRNYIRSSGLKKGDRLFNISDRMVREVVYRLSSKYLGRRVRPHALRHAYAMRILSKTRNLEYVRRLLGHSDYSTLKVYLDYTVEDIKHEILEALSTS